MQIKTGQQQYDQTFFYLGWQLALEKVKKSEDCLRSQP